MFLNNSEESFSDFFDFSLVSYSITMITEYLELNLYLELSLCCAIYDVNILEWVWSSIEWLWWIENCVEEPYSDLRSHFTS